MYTFSALDESFNLFLALKTVSLSSLLRKRAIIGLGKLLEASSERGFPNTMKCMEVDIFYIDIHVIFYYIIHYIHAILVITFRY